MEHDTPEPTTASVTRRRAIKTGAAVAAGAVVWAEPTIKGLARRPAYAAPGSGAPTVYAIPPLTFPLPGTPTAIPFPPQLTLTLDGGPMNFTLTATSADGCPCEFTVPGLITFTSAIGETATSTYPGTGNVVSLVWPHVNPPVAVTSLAMTITCG